MPPTIPDMLSSIRFRIDNDQIAKRLWMSVIRLLNIEEGIAKPSKREYDDIVKLYKIDSPTDIEVLKSLFGI